MKLKILHTNDVHSNYSNFARAVTLLKELKDENTLLLDSGDFADFKSIELQGTRGIAALELLKSAGYDALTIGNNEMFNGIDTLEHMATHSSIPFISNNLVKKDKSEIQGVVKSTILHKSGLRILITGSSPDLEVFNDGLGIHVFAYQKKISEEISRNKGKYDLCILLSHLGTFADEPLTSSIPEIDLIISAHDHKLYPKAKILNGTIMNSAGNYGEHIGLVELEIVNGKAELIHSETLPTRDIEMDPQILQILRDNKTKAIAVLSEPLYELKLPLWHDIIEENPLTNLIADGLRDMLKCDIGLINSGIANAGAFDFLSRKKLIEICPSPLNPTSFEIQGKDLQQALGQSLDAQVCLADGRGPGFRGKFIGRLHISGAVVVHNGNEIQEILINNKPLVEDCWYTVASTDYLKRGSGYTSLANNRKAVYRAEEIKDVIRIYANKKEFLNMSMKNRWKVSSSAFV
ncbi:5'-nucleotidase C-terminal domain-containing protein [Planococcus sp. N028]|uniref:5'-nucleotidase C-terminal domain-containing protein n=1 Tax=Planococcus shixiaomingii TaxID=3058393 RepID=A0ABT8N4H1_9BACL|nr:5'-nucleotidase C-terminal domain-containing protein [Planococcus sp. N028]MDN7242785.1 5'-nucleotidase C-terminal domain-containing protein [Planococcus sp. N028]